MESSWIELASCLELACLQRKGAPRRGWGEEGKGRYMEKKIKREGASSGALRIFK